MNGAARPDSTLARVTLRPIGSPLPLGAFTLYVAVVNVPFKKEKPNPFAARN